MVNTSRQALTTHVTDNSNSNIIFLDLLKISPDTRFALTRRCGTLSVEGAAPCRRLGPSSTIAGVDIDNIVRNAVVTDIDAEQRRSILTDIVIILYFQVLRLRLGVRAMEGVLIRPGHGDPKVRQTERLTLPSSTVHQWFMLVAPGHV